MKPEYDQISWQEFVDSFDWSSFLSYLTSGYGSPVWLAVLVFPLVFFLRGKPKTAVRTAAFIQWFSLLILVMTPEIYGGPASGYDLMKIDLYVIRLIWVLLLIGGTYWTMSWTHRYQIGGRMVMGLGMLFWGLDAWSSTHH